MLAGNLINAIVLRFIAITHTFSTTSTVTILTYLFFQHKKPKCISTKTTFSNIKNAIAAKYVYAAR
jgi:hypothetical protein